MADAGVNPPGLHFHHWLIVLSWFMLQHSHCVLTEHIRPTILPELRRHLPFAAFHVVMAFLESTVIIPGLVGRSLQCLGVLTEVDGFVVFS